MRPQSKSWNSEREALWACIISGPIKSINSIKCFFGINIKQFSSITFWLVFQIFWPHFMALFSFYTLWKHQKTRRFTSLLSCWTLSALESSIRRGVLRALGNIYGTAFWWKFHHRHFVWSYTCEYFIVKVRDYKH